MSNNTTTNLLSSNYICFRCRKPVTLLAFEQVQCPHCKSDHLEVPQEECWLIHHSCGFQPRNVEKQSTTSSSTTTNIRLF